MKIAKNIEIREMVNRTIYEKYKENSIWFLDERLINLLQEIRDYFDNPIMINDWNIGGYYDERGFREPGTKTGSHYSQHKQGRAADFEIQFISSLEVQAELIKTTITNKRTGIGPLYNLNCIKSGTLGFTHVDVRQTKNNDLFIIK